MTMTDPLEKAFDSNDATGRDPKSGKFLVGHKRSRGRPKGSRVKLSEKFFAALHDDFEENGVAAIARMRFQDPSAYVSVIAKLMPQKLEVEHTVVGGMSDEDLERMIDLADRMIASADVIEGEGRDVTPVLPPPLAEAPLTAAEQRADAQRMDLNDQHDALVSSASNTSLAAWYADTYPAQKAAEQLVQAPPYPVGPGVPPSAREEERRNLAKLYEAEFDPKDLF